jgi:hypothetical protein
MAGPADTGPFMLMVTGAITGPWPRAQPVINAAQDNPSIRLFNMDVSPSLAVRPFRPAGGVPLLVGKRDGAFSRLVEERALGKGISKPLGAHELEPVSLSELIHEHIRAAIETAVNEELRAALGTAS